MKIAFALLLGCFLLAAPLARADDAVQGAIMGVVTDPDKKPIPSFILKLQVPPPPMQIQTGGGLRKHLIGSNEQPTELQADEGTYKTIAQVTTDVNGNYKFDHLKAGTYLVVGGSDALGLVNHLFNVTRNEPIKHDLIARPRPK